MDNSFKMSLILCSSALGIAGAVLGILNIARSYGTLAVYNYILLVLMTIIILITICVLSSLIIVPLLCKRALKNKFILSLLAICLRYFLPIWASLTWFSKKQQIFIQNMYINLNNFIVHSSRKKYLPEKTLVILPHCMQNSSCNCKLTNNIENCIRCKKCNIADILNFCNNNGVKVVVVTGGTAARHVIKTHKPKFVLSVACERDLFSGILDIKKVPVIGIINKRPYGPCYNTSVSVNMIFETLEHMCFSIYNKRT